MRDNMNEKTDIPQKAIEALDVSIENLEPQILARLRQGRIKAIESAEARKHRFFPLIPRWLMTSGFATTAILVIAASFWFSAQREIQPYKSMDEIELISSNDQLELYEDLDFYFWLTDEDHSG